MTNLKLVLKVYTAYRQMSPDDIALLETLRALNESDREMLMETMAGKPATKKTATKTRTYQRCEQCGKTKGHVFHKDSSNDGYHIFQPPVSSSKSQQLPSKSPRASGMAAQLNRSLAQQRAVTTTKDDDYDPDAERCTFPRDGGKVCFLLPDHNIHHMKSAQGFHPFQLSSDAPPAPASSPANGGASGSTVNSEAGKENVSTATGD